MFVEGEVKRPGHQVLKSAGRLVMPWWKRAGSRPRPPERCAWTGATVPSRTARPPGGSASKGTGPTPEDRQNLSLLLAPGDVITVQVRRYVAVSGAVVRPGTYILGEGMTVTQALEAAGGITRLGNPKVVLERAHVAEGEPKKIEVDTRAVKAGEVPDATLQADDRLLVRGRKL